MSERPSFLRPNDSSLYVCTTFCLSIHWVMDGHSVCFHLLALVDNAAVHEFADTSLWPCFLYFGLIAGSRIAV